MLMPSVRTPCPPSDAHVKHMERGTRAPAEIPCSSDLLENSRDYFPPYKLRAIAMSRSRTGSRTLNALVKADVFAGVTVSVSAFFCVGAGSPPCMHGQMHQGTVWHEP